jgi:hypothetical protein
MFTVQKKQNQNQIISIFFLTLSLSVLGNWTDNLSTKELYEYFRYDPYRPSFAYQLENRPELIDELKANYERATFAALYMGYSGSTPLAVKDYLYRFARCMEDPLAYDHFHTIKNTPEDQKVFKMHQCVQILEDRLAYTQLLRWKVEEMYKEQRMDSSLQKELLEKIWKARYVFATAMNDPAILIFIEKHLPGLKEIPVVFQENIIKRWFRMRAKMEEFGIEQYARNGKIEHPLYSLLDVMDKNPDPFAVIDSMKWHSSDIYSDFYNVFFDEYQLSRAFKHDMSLLQDIAVPSEISTFENVEMRLCYEKLLILKLQTDKMRNAVRANLKIIMHACRAEKNKERYTMFAQLLFDIIAYDNNDRYLLDYPDLLVKSLQDDNISLLNELIAYAKKSQNRSLDTSVRERIKELAHTHNKL